MVRTHDNVTWIGVAAPLLLILEGATGIWWRRQHRRPARFVLLDLDSGETVATFDSWKEAGEGLERLDVAQTRDVEALALISYSRRGEALEPWLATDPTLARKLGLVSQRS